MRDQDCCLASARACHGNRYGLPIIERLILHRYQYTKPPALNIWLRLCEFNRRSRRGEAISG